jgi:hypothetical protein
MVRNHDLWDMKEFQNSSCELDHIVQPKYYLNKCNNIYSLNSIYHTWVPGQVSRVLEVLNLHICNLNRSMHVNKTR